MLNMTEIDADSYHEFRANLNRLALQIGDPGSEEDRLTLMRMMVHEFVNYKAASEKAQHEHLASWRSLIVRMAQDLLVSKGINPVAPTATLLLEEAGRVSATGDMHKFREMLDALARAGSDLSSATVADLQRTADLSTGNDNAVGLPGSGAAVERVKRIMGVGGAGYIVLFRLSCLDVIRQRFGPEAVQDALMAVSSFLTSSLHSDDSIFHWSDSALLAILQGRASEQILAAELQRIVMQNRETTVNIGGRNVMMRIPISFDLTAISKLRSADDMLNLSWLLDSKR